MFVTPHIIESTLDIPMMDEGLLYVLYMYSPAQGMQQRSWLRHYATSRKVTGSSPNEVDFFNLLNPSSHTMALGSTQSASNRNEYQESSWGGKVRLAHRADN
jgi:hypothetical protein